MLVPFPDELIPQLSRHMGQLEGDPLSLSRPSSRHGHPGERAYHFSCSNRGYRYTVNVFFKCGDHTLDVTTMNVIRDGLQ